MKQVPNRKPDATYHDNYHKFWFVEMIRTVDESPNEAIDMWLNNNNDLSDNEDEDRYIQDVQNLYKAWMSDQVEKILLVEDEL